jgi:hypothetical protein
VAGGCESGTDTVRGGRLLGVERWGTGLGRHTDSRTPIRITEPNFTASPPHGASQRAIRYTVGSERTGWGIYRVGGGTDLD